MRRWHKEERKYYISYNKLVRYGSTHNDTLTVLAEVLWEMGATSISLGERSLRPIREVMEPKGILPLLGKLNVKIIDFDLLDSKDWILPKPKESHWADGIMRAAFQNHGILKVVKC